MDCQSYSYSRLDSSEAEVCQKMDQVSDLRIQIDSEKPLIEPVKQVSGIKTVKTIKNKKRVLSTLDIFISVFIVTPCVVGCWRGVWQLMDIYAVYFPAWESFFIGMITHVVLALGQDVFHSVVVEKKTKKWITKVFSLFLMKFYVTTFNVVTNLIWRGGWLIFDRYCRVELTDTGAATWESSTNALWFTIVCTLILFSLKGLKNTMSPPFSIAMDSKDEVFLFRTTYIYKAIYIVVSLTKKSATCVQNSPAVTEKLISSQSTQVEYRQNQPPRPFGINILGPPPQKFTPSTSTPAQATTNYPQLTQYRNNYYPKNIQDIIGYVTKNRSYNINMNSYKDKQKQQATNQEGLMRTYNNSGGFTTSDPFYPFKPTDPSEINLLATANFRFSPPIWKNFQKLYQQPTQQPSQVQQHVTLPYVQQVENSKVQEAFKNLAKPFVVTINIYPTENELNQYGQKVLSPRTNSYYPHRPQGDPRAKINNAGSKMTIYLDVFPQTFLPFLNQHNERYTEDAGNKIKFV